jgi:hypothetical protein
VPVPYVVLVSSYSIIWSNDVPVALFKIKYRTTQPCEITKKFLTRESSGGHQARKRKKGRKNLSPRSRKA